MIFEIIFMSSLFPIPICRFPFLVLKIAVTTYMHTYIHTYIHTCMHACMHTYIHTYIHTYFIATPQKGFSSYKVKVREDIRSCYAKYVFLLGKINNVIVSLLLLGLF